MQKSDFSSEISSDGYMLFYKKRPIGGAGVVKRESGSRRVAAHKQADVQMYSEEANRDIDALVAGHGQARFIKAIEEVEMQNSTLLM